MSSPQMEFKTIKELRKIVGAMRKEGCPSVSKLSREGLLEEMAAYSAGIKARRKAQPVDMKEKSGKPKAEKAAPAIATVKEKAEKLMMFSNPMVATMAKSSGKVAVAKAAQKIEHTPAVVAAVAEGKIEKAKKIAKKVAKKEGVPAAVAAEVVEHVAEVEKPKSKFDYKPIEMNVNMAEMFYVSALQKSNKDISEAIEDFELQIEDYNDMKDNQMKKAYKEQNDIMIDKVNLYKLALKKRGETAEKGSIVSPKTKAKRPASAYAIAVGKYMKQGMKMAEASAAAKKELGK
jgi:hypothetical protein